MSARIDLQSLSREGTERFLQTVLVIDNELTLGQPVSTGTSPLTAPIGSLLQARRAKIVPGPQTEEPGAQREAVPVSAASAVASTPVSDPASPLDVKSIMDAFLKRSLICGMHRPAKGDDLVTEAITAARRSDAVIVDWLLQGSDSSAAQDIIAGILEGDAAEHGRLRLIVVYTSEPDIGEITRALTARLAGKEFLDQGPGLLTRRDTRIVVLNKVGTKGAPIAVSIEALPEKIIEEFARLSEGLLSTFAVSAVAAVRRATHHVLAVFSSEMDGAYLAHRCALKMPEDATEFALELLAGELRGVAAMNEETLAILSEPPLAAWIGNRAKDGRIHGGPLSLPIDVAQNFASGGEEAVEASKCHQVRTGAEKLSKEKKELGKDVSKYPPAKPGALEF